MTGGASRQGAQPCLVRSLPGRPAKRVKAAKGEVTFDRLRMTGEIAAHPADARNDKAKQENPPVSPFMKGGSRTGEIASAWRPPPNEKRQFTEGKIPLFPPL